MHLSPLVDSLLVDTAAATTCVDLRASRTPGQMHLDGVVRGLVVLVSLALPFSLAAGASALHHGDAGRAAIESR